MRRLGCGARQRPAREAIYLGLAANRLIYIASLAGAAMSIQGAFDTVDQNGASEGLGQKANGPTLDRSGADALIGEGRNEDEWHLIIPASHIRQKVQTAHSRHLHIRNDA
jgi:hypothetical protein